MKFEYEKSSETEAEVVAAEVVAAEEEDWTDRKKTAVVVMGTMMGTDWGEKKTEDDENECWKQQESDL